MVGWIILGVLVGLIVLIMLIPVGADIRYEDGVIRISVKADGMKIQLIPKKKKNAESEKPKPEKEPEPKTDEPERKKKKQGSGLSLNAEEIIELLKTAIRGLGKFCRKLKVDRFLLHWIAAGDDPYIVARVFAVVNAGLSELAPLCTERFHCRNSSVWTDIDFAREDMFFEFGLTMTIRIGQIVAVGIYIAAGALVILLRSRRRVKQETKQEEKALQQWLETHPEEADQLRREVELQEEKTA